MGQWHVVHPLNRDKAVELVDALNQAHAAHAEAVFTERQAIDALTVATKARADTYIRLRTARHSLSEYATMADEVKPDSPQAGAADAALAKAQCGADG